MFVVLFQVHEWYQGVRNKCFTNIVFMLTMSKYIIICISFIQSDAIDCVAIAWLLTSALLCFMVLSISNVYVR